MKRSDTVVFLRCIFLGALFVLLFQIDGQAQPMGGPGFEHGPGMGRKHSPEKRKALMKRIEQLKVWRLTERLNLSEEQSVKFFPKYKTYQQKFAAHFEQMHEQMKALRAMKKSNASETEIDAKINDFLNTQAAMPKLLREHIKEFRQVLSAHQIAELILFERDFMRDLKGLLRKSHRHGDRFDRGDKR